MNLKGKNVLITGATEGLGLSLTKLLLKKGYNLYGVARGQKRIDKVKIKFKSPKLEIFQCDVSDYDQIESIVKKVGKVDILINNAGVWIEGRLQDNQINKISEAIDINLKGVIYTTKAVLPVMLKHNKGYIINISSTSGLKGRSGQSVYVASKFGVTGFTESLKEDLKDTNIKVAGFYPGGMNTKLFEKAGTPKNNIDWMDTDKVAEIIVFMLERDDTMVMDHVVLNKRGTKSSN